MYQFENITIRYDKRCILEKSTFSIAKGFTYILIGRNGSGKSSLLKKIKEIYGNQWNIRILPQHTVNNSYTLSVSDTLSAFCRYEKIIDWKKRTEKNIECFELTDLKNRLIENLSGGEKQRVLLAQIFLGDADIIFLDEPFANIDIDYKLRFYTQIRQIAKEENISVIVIEHDLRLALESNDPILFCLQNQKKVNSFKPGSEDLKMAIQDEFKVDISQKNTYLPQS